MKRVRAWIVGLWLAGLAVCALVAARTHYVADLSAFLPAFLSLENRNRMLSASSMSSF